MSAVQVSQAWQETIVVQWNPDDTAVTGKVWQLPIEARVRREIILALVAGHDEGTVAHNGFTLCWALWSPEREEAGNGFSCPTSFPEDAHSLIEMAMN